MIGYDEKYHGWGANSVYKNLITYQLYLHCYDYSDDVLKFVTDLYDSYDIKNLEMAVLFLENSERKFKDNMLSIDLDIESLMNSETTKK